MASVWTQTETPPRFPSLEGDLKTETLIIGGGDRRAPLRLFPGPGGGGLRSGGGGPYL